MIGRVAIVGLLISRVAAAQTPSSSQLIAGALLPLPEQLRAGASVVRVDDSSHLDTLRQGTNGMTCRSPHTTRPETGRAPRSSAGSPFTFLSRRPPRSDFPKKPSFPRRDRGTSHT